jgi:hypothetical protein
MFSGLSQHLHVIFRHALTAFFQTLNYLSLVFILKLHFMIYTSETQFFCSTHESRKYFPLHLMKT